jgi:hypothetical protein
MVDSLSRVLVKQRVVDAYATSITTEEIFLSEVGQA